MDTDDFSFSFYDLNGNTSRKSLEKLGNCCKNMEKYTEGLYFVIDKSEENTII
jgi:hypothetical protein